MMRSTTLPLLPGNTFNNRIGRTKFHKSQFFEYIKGHPMPTDKLKPDIGRIDNIKWCQKYPSLYAKGEVAELPAWISFDKQVLSFDGYFQETAQERNGYAHQIRKCKIYFFLEDGTVQVSEPRIINSGIPQGTVIRRQKIPFPVPRNYEFYDILDFNVGCTVELYGRVYKITNCDNYTRTFLNRLGVSVPDPLPIPNDPYLMMRSKASCAMAAKKPNVSVDTRGQFLEHEKHVLRFCGYWDNRKQMYGTVHHLTLHYFLTDDTIEIKEILPPNSGREVRGLFLRRGKLPKYRADLPTFGHDSPFSVLNVMTTGFLTGHYIPDTLNCGLDKTEYYSDKDLSIGATLNIYGRSVVLTDCDTYTKEYYRFKYGIEEFVSIAKPDDNPICINYEKVPLPPYNGWGSYDDSAGNCLKMIPKPPKRDFVRFCHKDRQGIDSNILRFHGKMVSTIPENRDREFIVSFYLSDDTITVFERARPNTGFHGGLFFSRAKMYKPGQDMFINTEREWYNAQDMFVGNTIYLNDYVFVLMEADEYALRYMELHPEEFTQNNPALIVNKVKEGLAPVAKEVYAKYSAKSPMPYCEMRSALKEILGNNITEQELVALARKYCVSDIHAELDIESLRAIAHTELKRYLYDELERLTEGFYEIDHERTGFVNGQRAYALCRAARIPLDKAFIITIIRKMPKDAQGQISYPDLLQFLDYKRIPTYHSIPVNQKVTFGITDPPYSAPVKFVDFDALLEDLNIKEALSNVAN